MQEYDVIIIGGGPAGLSAALYAARGEVKVLVLEKALPGGELNNTVEIENYPGIEGKTGPEIAMMMTEHAKRFGAEFKELLTIKEIDLQASPKVIKTDLGDFTTNAVIIGTGSEHRKLDVPGEKELAGRGVSYCAVCDGAFFKNKHIAVIGGGNSAIEEGIFLTRFAEKVSIIHRRDKLRADKILQERAFNNPKISFIWDSTVEQINGEKSVSSITLKSTKTGETTDFSCEGVFVYVGLEPNVELFKDQVTLDEGNRIITNNKMETNLPGVYAAGDVRNTSLRQAVTAASDGAMAATFALNYLESL